jgi:hypothetical protein
MSEDRVTIDKIVKMFWEVSGHKADATQTDALQLLLEGYAAQQALAYKDAPTQLIESLLNSLHHQASQILDTGGRMRLSPYGALDAKDEPLALAADVEMVDRKVARLHSALNEMLTAQVQMNERQEEYAARQARHSEVVNTSLDIVAQDLRRLQEAELAIAAKVLEQRQATERLSSAVEALVTTVTETLAGRGQVEKLADQVTRLRQVISDAMQSPKPQPEPMALPQGMLARHEPITVSDDRLTAWLNDPALVEWERNLLEEELAKRLTAKPEPGSSWEAMTAPLSAEDIEQLKADAAAGKVPVRRINASRVAAPVRFEDGRPVFPGCFFNDDGTITCRTCGEAKMPSPDPKVSAYYKDRQAQTGYKSDCKDCEKAGKAAKMAARAA